jgi:hypothetical protein
MYTTYRSFIQLLFYKVFQQAFLNFSIGIKNYVFVGNVLVSSYYKNYSI